MRPMSWVRVAVAVGLAVVLSSCGGGGGGGGSSTSVDINPSQLTYLGFVGQSFPNQTINVKLRSGSGTYHGVVTPGQGMPFKATFTPTGDTDAVINLRPAADATTDGSGTVNFKVCRDAACKEVELSRDIPYTLKVFQISATSLTFSGNEGADPPAQTLTITPSDTQRGLRAYAYTSASLPWLSASRGSDSTFIVSAKSAGLAPGTHAGYVSILQGDSGVVTISVSFTVGNGTMAPSARNIEFNGTSISANTVGSFPVSFVGSQSPAWSATSDRPWLVLDATSGTGTGTIPYRIASTQLGGIANWSSDTATVTIKSSGLTDVSFPVTLTKKLPEVNAVWFTPLTVGRTGTVKASGRGFSQLPPNSLQVVGVSGVTSTVLSDREALVSLPALATAGSYEMKLPNAAGLPSLSARFTVAPSQPTLNYATVGNAGNKRSMVFDASRTALFAVNTTRNTVTRYQLTGGSWQVSEAPVAEIGNIGLSPDKQTLYVTSGRDKLHAMDPTTLQTRSTHTLPDDLVGGVNLRISTNQTVTPLAITNDMRMWFGYAEQFNRVAYFDLIDSTFHFYSGVGLPDTYSNLYGLQLTSTPDGSSALFIQFGDSSPSYIYSASTGVLTSPKDLPRGLYDMQFSDDNTKLLSNRGVLYETSGFTKLGSVTATSPAVVTNLGIGKTVLSALSPDGTRIYLMSTENEVSKLVKRVEVFDTAGFVKVADIPLTDQAGSCGGSVYVSDCGILSIHPDGKTLFWAGDERLVVIPVSMRAFTPAKAGVDAGPLWSKPGPAAAKTRK